MIHHPPLGAASRTIPTESTGDAPAPLAPRTGQNSSRPACFERIQPGEPLDSHSIGQCFKALADMEARGEKDAWLEEHLYECIATAPSINLKVDEQQWPMLKQAQQAFREKWLQPEALPTRPQEGVRCAYNWVGQSFERLLPPRRGQPTHSSVMDKPVPVANGATVVYDMPLRARLAAREAPPGATLAENAGTEGSENGRWRLRLREDRSLAMETSKTQRAPGSLELCRDTQSDWNHYLDNSANIGDFVNRFNQDFPEHLKLQLTEIGSSPAVKSAALSPMSAAGPERTLECSYAALGKDVEATALLKQAPDVQARLSRAREAAHLLEFTHIRRARTQFHQPSELPRADLVQGLITQLLMETTDALQQRVPPNPSDTPQESLSFKTPLPRTATLLRPLEQVALQNMCADHISVADFVKSEMTPEQIEATRAKHGSVTGLVKQTLAPLRESINTAMNGARDAGSTGQWPNISISSGTPRVALTLTAPPPPPSYASLDHDSLSSFLSDLSTRPQPRSASPQAPASPEYLEPDILEGRFEDSLGEAEHQPAWLRLHLAGAPQELNLEDSGPAALPYDSLEAPRTGQGQALGPRTSVGTSADKDSAAGAATAAAAPPAITKENFDERMDQIVQEIRTRGHWQGFSSELGPRLLVDCPAWPGSRSLDIVNQKTGDLMLSTGKTAPGAKPVTLSWDPRSSHYSPVLNGTLRKAPANGDCFYHSALLALGPKDRQAMLRSIGAPPDSSVRYATDALRDHFAGHLDLNRDDYREAISDLYGMMEK